MKVILAEKPSVARDIAKVLGARSKKDGYIEGNGYQITWAFGHLVELQPPDAYDSALKRWSLAPLPFIPDTFKLRISSNKGVKKQFNTIKKLFSQSDEIICATDAGREGELIFRYIAQLCRVKNKPKKRLWISSLTDSAIRKGFSSLQPLANFDNLSDAAKCRSEADWIIGLNATRGYTVKHSHGRGVLSVGRVQTPVLAMIVNRDHEIRNFKPEKYWELWTDYRQTKFKHIRDRFEKKEDAQNIFQKVRSQALQITDINEKKSSQMPPKLFDLTELQRVMNRKAGFPAAKTLTVAQSLYESKLISYPRTDSRYLTDDIFPQCGSTLGSLQNIRPQEIGKLNLTQLRKHRNYFNNSKVNDHHAIIPTGQKPGSLSYDEQKVYKEILTRFIAIFYPASEKAHTTVTAHSVQEEFKAKGTRVVVPGWLELYGNSEKKKDEEQDLPAFSVGESGPHSPEIRECQTKPPKSFNEASLLSAMETAGKQIDDDELKEAMKERGLGTPATRASIIEVLVKREYIRKEKRNLHATDKGEELIRLLTNQQTLTSPELTGDWENKLKLMEKGQFESTAFMTEVKDFAEQIVSALNVKMDNTTGYGPCPLCSSPVIKGKTGFGCSAWKAGCQFRFHAQQFGSKIKEEDVPGLISVGKLSRPRKLIDNQGQEVSGYITMNKQGQIGILTKEEKISADSIGSCPLCRGNVLEKYKGFSCDSCDFIIWNKIAGRKTSKALVQVLLSKGKSQVLKGFRSKAGKKFSAALVLKNGKVEFDFNS